MGLLPRKMRALVDLARAGGGTSKPEVRMLALRACADFCLDEENFQRFAEWAATRPVDWPYGWSDSEELRQDVEAGRAVTQAYELVAPMITAHLEQAMSEVRTEGDEQEPSSEPRS